MVFAREMGAAIDDRGIGIDCDEFDRHCDHLIVRDRPTSKVIGTYRILSAEDAQAAGGFYSEREFDLHNLSYLRPHITEIGRACVHRDHRSGSVIVALWTALARYLVRRQCRYVIGCASIPVSEDGRAAAAVYRRLRQKKLQPFAMASLSSSSFQDRSNQQFRRPPIPPLIRGYLKLGAYVCGEPAWDPDFKTADVFMMLPMARMNAAHARHFFGPGAGEARAAAVN